MEAISLRSALVWLRRASSFGEVAATGVVEAEGAEA